MNKQIIKSSEAVNKMVDMVDGLLTAFSSMKSGPDSTDDRPRSGSFGGNLGVLGQAMNFIQTMYQLTK